jgi:hypothetical protein
MTCAQALAKANDFRASKGVGEASDREYLARIAEALEAFAKEAAT